MNNNNTNTSTAESTNSNSYNRHTFPELRNNAFWEFYFSKHSFDQERKEAISRIIKILEQNGNRLKFHRLNMAYFEKHGKHLDSHFLRELFACRLMPPGQEIEVFRRTGPIFRVEEPDYVCFVYYEDGNTEKDIFVSSKPRMNEDIHRNVKLADKVFEILPVQRKMNIIDVMDRLVRSKEYLEVKEKSPEAPHLEPVKLIGFLQLYWSDVFKIWTEQETRQVWIKRHVLHHSKPSQEKKYMKEIIFTQPCFPIPADILTDTHVVKLLPCKLPTDGIGLQLLALQDEFDYINRELRKYYSEIMSIKDRDERKCKRLHPNETYEGTCCLRMTKDDEGEEVFRRCRITGQSNGLAMVQDADYARHVLEEVKNLFQIPRYLLGVPQTCVYGVVEGFKTATENEKALWDEHRKTMSKRSVRCVARFHRVAERVDYSGRRKHAIYMVIIKVNKLGEANPLLILPGSY